MHAAIGFRMAFAHDKKYIIQSKILLVIPYIALQCKHLPDVECLCIPWEIVEQEYIDCHVDICLSTWYGITSKML